MNTNKRENTFPKTEKLKEKIKIKATFSEGKVVKSGTLKVLFKKQELRYNVPAQVLISVPKRNQKLAVNRNRKKRQIREVFRLNKGPLYEFLSKENLQISLVFIFLGNQDTEYETLNSTMVRAIEKIIKKISDEA